MLNQQHKHKNQASSPFQEPDESILTFFYSPIWLNTNYRAVVAAAAAVVPAMILSLQKFNSKPVQLILMLRYSILHTAPFEILTLFASVHLFIS
jgi:hypothetical protein